LRDRLIDVALLVALILAAGAVGWTLLSLGRFSTQPSYEPPSVASDDPITFGIQPINPGIQADTPEPSLGLDGKRPVVAEVVTGGESGDVAMDGTEVVTGSPIILERLGFSFVTGGSGACGVVLEPWRHVAVSRELLTELGCGTEIHIGFDSSRGGRTEIRAIVGDTMNPSHYRTVNVFVGQNEPALEYGVTTGWLER
jgi:hypothetical protein